MKKVNSILAIASTNSKYSRVTHEDTQTHVKDVFEQAYLVTLNESGS